MHRADFILSRCGTQRVKANNIYQEYIRDKHHLHMNATRWVTLTGFIQHLGQAGIVRVEETEKGLFISWIDNSPKALAKAVSAIFVFAGLKRRADVHPCPQEANMKKERLNKSDEQRERDMIAEQIERAAAAQDDTKDTNDSGDSPPTELKRNEGEKVKLSLSLKKPALSTAPTTSGSPPVVTEQSTGPSTSTPAESGTSAPPVPFTTASKPATPASTNVFKSNVFKTTTKQAPINVFKTGIANSSKASTSGTNIPAGVKRPLSVTEQLMQEDMERKRRRMEREGARG